MDNPIGYGIAYDKRRTMGKLKRFLRLLFGIGGNPGWER